MKKLLILTGSGISAESGLKTFRDTDGLWEGFQVEEVATPEAFEKHPERVLEFYNLRRRQVIAAQPNAAHYGLVSLEKYFDVGIVTQNVDDLHERAGSSTVLHLHGEILKMRSIKDNDTRYPITGDIHLGDLADDGGQLRPDIVWFGEAVDMIYSAAEMVAEADIFVIIGTSLLVYPAAGLINVKKNTTPCFVLDRSIPILPADISGITLLEQPATEGINELVQQLIRLS